MKQVTIINKVIPAESRSKYGTSGRSSVISGGASVDLSPYLLKAIWERNIEERTDEAGNEYIYIKKPIVGAAGLTLFAGEQLKVDSIFKGLPLDTQTLQWTEDGRLTVVGGAGGGTGDLDEEKLWQLLGSTGTQQINSTHMSDALKGYLKEADLTEAVKNFVTLYTDQSITGMKTFVNGLMIGEHLIKIINGVLTLDCSLAVTGGITTYAIGEQTASTIMDGIVCDETTITKSGGKLTVIGGTGGGLDDVTVTGTGNAVTSASLSGNVLTLTKGSTFLLASQYTASDILSKLKTVDGTGSGLDADLLDGKHYSDIIGGNVASATKLQTARTIWGQSFDGTQNVSGSLTGVTSIDASSYITCDELQVGSSRYYDGNIELYHATPFIDFHYEKSSADYTSRIIEAGNGLLSINNRLYIKNNGNVGVNNSSPSRQLDVSGSAGVTELYINGIRLYRYSSGVLMLDGNLAVTGGITAFAQGVQSVPTIMDGIVCDNTTIHVNNSGKLEVIGGTGGDADSASKLVPGRNINGKLFDGTKDIVTDMWGASRYFYIRDAYAEHTGSYTSVNGSETVYLNLPTTMTANIEGNASTATKLQTGRTINGKLFDGTENIVTDMWGATRNVYIRDAYAEHTGDYTQVNGSGTIYLNLPTTMTANIDGNASTATKLQIPRTINGTSFDGSGSIVTESWGASRYFYIRDAGENNISEGILVNGASTNYLKLPSSIQVNNLTANNSIYINGIRLYKIADGAIMIDGNLAVTGGITCYATGTETFDSGFIELHRSVPYIEFYYNNAINYTSKIQESSSGLLNINSILYTKNGTNVGIGTSSPSSSYKLHVNGSTNTTDLYIDGVRLYRSSSGTITLSGSLNVTGTINGSSSGGDVSISSMTSTSSTNLSLTIGNSTKAISDLYATYTDYLRTSRTIWGQLFNGGSNVTGAMSSVSSIKFTNNGSIDGGCIELYRESPFIDFHYGNSTSDYTSRIIESSSGVLNLNNRLYVTLNGKFNALAGISSTSSEWYENSFTIAGDSSLGYGMNLWTTWDGKGHIQSANSSKSYFDLILAEFGGRVGVGTTSPTEKLTVSGNIRTTGTVSQGSDIRWKTGIATLTNRGYLNPVSFYKDGSKQLGFIAQEVQMLYPELVSDDGSDKRYLYLNYVQIVAVLEAQIIELKNKIEELENKLNVA